MYDTVAPQKFKALEQKEKQTYEFKVLVIQPHKLLWKSAHIRNIMLLLISCDICLISNKVISAHQFNPIIISNFVLFSHHL